MITDKSPSSITVTLILSTATRQDSGLYSCQPSGETELEAAELSVIVLQQIDYTAMLSQAGGEISLVLHSADNSLRDISPHQDQAITSLCCCSSLLSSSRPPSCCCC